MRVLEILSNRNLEIWNVLLGRRLLKSIDSILPLVDLVLSWQHIFDLQILEVLLHGLDLLVVQPPCEVDHGLPPPIPSQHGMGVGVGLARSRLVDEVEVPCWWCPSST